MKTKIILMFAVLFFIALLLKPQKATAADTLNPCWTLTYPNDPAHNMYNPDTVMYDSCKCPKTIFGKHGIGCKYIYAKRYFFCRFPYRALIIPYAPRDSVIYRTWQDIDTNFTLLRDSLSKMEIKYGKFYLQKGAPDAIDSNSLASREFYLLFDNYQPIDSIVNFLKNIKTIEACDYLHDDTQLLGSVAFDINDYNNFLINFTDKKIIIEKKQDNIYQTDNIHIYNYLGAMVCSKEFSNIQQIIIDISNFNYGVYFLIYNNIHIKFIKY
jgi:hypothetical protein